MAKFDTLSTPPITGPITIDIGPFLDVNASPEDRLIVAKNWHYAMSTLGMCIITNHGISAQELNNLYSVALDFFQLPLDEKMKYCLHKGYGHGGYTPQGVEAVSRSTARNAAPPDLVENIVFNFGCDPDKELVIPCEPAYLKDRVQSYWSLMAKLTQSLMRLSAMALNLPEHFFLQFYQNPKINLKLAYYAPLDQYCSSQPFPETQHLRYGCHTDYTGFTILRQDMHTPGLEVELPSGEWVPVFPDPSIPDALVINAGDLIQIWTNDICRSPPHRVIARPLSLSSAGRLSLVLFTGPAGNTIVEPLPGCHGDNRPKRYAPVNAHEHLGSV